MAEELHVTQSAVSRRIRALELELGAGLFRRTTRGLEPTHEGCGLAAAVRRGLADIAAGVAAFDADAGTVLTVSALPSLATRWPVPRLGRFRERRPEVEVRINADEHLAQLHGGEADLAIRFCLGRYPGLQAVVLMGDAAQPVLSPRLLERHDPLRDPGALARLPLLHDVTAASSGATGRAGSPTPGGRTCPATAGYASATPCSRSRRPWPGSASPWRG